MSNQAARPRSTSAATVLLLGAFYASSVLAQNPGQATLEEIVVTAQKRSENLQTVSVSISAFDESLLQALDLKNGRDLSHYVPNLTITSQYNSSQPYIFIRGVGTRSFAASDTGAVGIYTDEIFLSALSGQMLQMFDLERVEVLRGPQGTLFGKNTTGGAISFISNRPTGKREFVGKVAYGRFDQIGVEGAAELPLVEGKSALRFAFGLQERDGILRNSLLNRDENDIGNWGARTMLSLTPSENVDVLLRLHYAKNDSGPLYYQQQGLLPGGTDAFGYQESPNPYRGAWDRRDAKDELEAYGLSGTVNWDLGPSTLTSISAYERHKRNYREEVDSSPINYINDNFINDTYQLTQELRLTSNADADLKWLLGAFFFYEDIDAKIQNELFQVLADFGVPFNPNDLFSGPFAANTLYAQTTSSGSVFGHLTYQFAPQWSINTGARYTYEEKKVDNVSISYSPSFANTQPTIDGGSRTAKYSAGEFSGHVALEYAPSDAALLYARLSRGFRSGGFNGAVFFAIDEFDKVDPEFVNSLELGAKTSWLDQRMTLNLSAFYNDLTDMQIITVQNTSSGGVRSALENAGEASTYGLEAELLAQPTPQLFTRLSVAYLHAEFDKYINASGVDLSGERPTNSPEFTVNGLIQYAFDLPGGWKLLPQVNASYTSDVKYEIEGDLGQDAYWLVNARLALLDQSGKYEIAAEVKNLTDKRYYSDAFDLPLFGFNAYAIADPRTWTVSVQKKF